MAEETQEKAVETPAAAPEAVETQSAAVEKPAVSEAAKTTEPPAAKDAGTTEPPAVKDAGATEPPAAKDAEAEGTSPAAAAAKPRGKGRSRSIPAGIAHIKATFNNTQVSISDVSGGVISWSNAGRAGFKGSRKSTAFAATLVAQDAARQAIGKGMHEVEVRVLGAGTGRESAIRGLQSAGMSITVIKDVTPVPHNGCRPRKRRRV